MATVFPKKLLDKIFQPFFTTKPTGQGTGLGLSLSYDIIKAHGGEIKVETKEGEGAEFIIQLKWSVRTSRASPCLIKLIKREKLKIPVMLFWLSGAKAFFTPSWSFMVTCLIVGLKQSSLLD